MKAASKVMVLLLALGAIPALGVSAKPIKPKVPPVQPCALVTRAEAEAICGKLKGNPKPDTGILGEKECHYENMEGQGVVLRVYTADRWGLKKGETSEMKPAAIKGLGNEAFWVKRGTDTEVYVRKSGLILEVDSSGGIDMARKMAQKAASRLPSKP